MSIDRWRHLYERESETGTLDRALAALADGAGLFVFIEAAAGLGKTSLLAYAREMAQQRSILVLQARAAHQETDFAYGVVGQLFGRVLRDADVQSRTLLLADAASEAADIILAGTSEDVGSNQLRSPNLHHQLHSLYWACANLGDTQPLLLLVDDAQWCDDASLQFLTYMARRIEDLPVVLVVAARSASRPSEDDLLDRLRQVEPADRLGLRPLTRTGVAALVDEAWASTADPLFIRACDIATGGNPYYVVEVSAELRSRGLRPDAAAAGRVQQTTPETVARSIAARLAHLSQSARLAAGALAVLGDGAAETDLGLVSGLPLNRLTAGLDALRFAGLVAAERPLAFVHPIVGSACYDQVGGGSRADLHRRAAMALAARHAPAEQVALHLTDLPRQADQWVAEQLHAAARAATARGALSASITLLRRCLDEPAFGDLADDAQRLLGLCELDLGRPEGLDRLLRYVQVCQDPVMAVGIVLDVAPVLALQGRPDAAISLLSSVSTTQAAGAPALMQLLKHERKSLAKLAPAWRGQPELEPPPIAAASSDRRSDRMAAAEYSLDLVLHCQDAATAATIALAALADGWPLDSMLDLTGFGQAIFTLLATDRTTEAAAALTQALTEARARGRLWLLVPLYAWRIACDLRTGDLQAAERAAHTTLVLTDDQEPTSQVATIGHLLPVLAELGRHDEADGQLDTRQLAGDVPAGLWYDFLIDGRIALRAAERRWDDVIGDADTLAARARHGVGANPSLSPYRSHLALAHLMNGNREEASQTAGESTALARQFGTPTALGISLRTQGRVAGGSAGIELLREAVQILDASPARLEHLRTCVWLGAALRRQGQRAEARNLLRQAHAGARSLGAQPLVNEANQEFKTAGGRALQPDTAHGLTPAEQRIAQTVQEGLTNRQIAQELFLSLKTVEMHLTRIYRKRGITNRADLMKQPPQN